jgi:uncharacterized protein (TIGR02391 family)
LNWETLRVVNRIPVFDPQFTEAVCNVLAQTESPGLTGPEIRSLLEMVRVSELEPAGNKRSSLYITLHNVQVRQACGNVLAAFIARAMSPARYVDNHRRWQQLRDQLNAVLVLYGFKINEQGKLATGTQASTLSEAAKLAGVLQAELRRRDIHQELFRYCEEEFISRDLFHAMSEAAKSVPQRVRNMTGLAGDGQVLFDHVFGSNQAEPMLLINDFRTDSDKSEHRGLKNLLIGIHGHYRNPRAHRTRLGSTEQLVDFYDLFGLLSYVHRKLDTARKPDQP